MRSAAERAARAALALSAVLLATGCGDAERPKAPATSATSGAPPAATAVQILSPQDRASVKAVDGVAIVFVKGTASPGAELRVRAEQCGPNCDSEVSAGSGGAWSTRIVAQVGKSRALTITASELNDPSNSDSIRLQASGGNRSEAVRSTTPRDQLIVIGDSLALGMKPYLSGSALSIDARIGRPLAEGMSLVEKARLPDPATFALAISLFTNDDPSNVAALRSAVASSLERVGEDGCVIWATIVAPAVNGVNFKRANALLEALADDEPRLQLVPWDAAVRRNPALLEPDDVHPTAAGYRLRAKLYRLAARRCGS